MVTKVIYFTVNGQDEQAEFRSDDFPDDIKDVFRAAAEAGKYDILKLYNEKGSIVNISPKLAENSPNSRYKLHVVASQHPGLTSNNLEFDLSRMEQRIQALEKKVFVDKGTEPEVLVDLKEKVDEFKGKLESVEHMSWLGLFKDLSSGKSLQPFWNQHKSAQTTAENNKRVFEQFVKMSQVQVSDQVREYLKKPTFDNWQWDDPEMLVLLRQMFIDLNLPTKFNIEMSTLHSWLFEVYKHYNHVPFHNFKHCFMVAQMMYGLIWLIGLQEKIDPLDILILITAAICHDLDHPGYNNQYQINARTELALRYNDMSPLENHHCSMAFAILEKSHCNIFKNLPKDTFKQVREGMIKCILATDMSKHSEILSSFKSVVPNFDFQNKDHKTTLRMILVKVADISNEARPMEVAEPWIDCLLTEFFNQLLMIFIKTADISNEARPQSVAEPWADCLFEEYFNQSDLEKLEGLPVAPFMDREKVSKPSSQVGFIKFVLLPLFEALGTLFPVIQNDIIQPVKNALQYYTDLQSVIEDEKHRKQENNSNKSAEDKNGIRSSSKNGSSKA